jgi:hypothetical protein
MIGIDKEFSIDYLKEWPGEGVTIKILSKLYAIQN